MKVLLLGGSGIISSAICDLCVKHGFDVFIINRGRRKKLINPQAKLILGDIKKDKNESLRNKLSLHKYDVVFDFTSYLPKEIIKNLDFLSNLFSQYIFISTAVVYDDLIESRYDESTPTTNCKWNYAVNKIECEKALINSALNNHFNYTIIRPYVTYGKTRFPFQISPLEYYTIINRIKNGKPIPIFNDEIYCTLTTANEFAVAAVGLILNKKAFGEVVNIVGNYETSWKKVVEIVADKYQIETTIIDISKIYPNKWKFLGFNTDEILGDKSRNMLFDNRKIKRLVPVFSGDTTFEDAVIETIEYYEKDISIQLVNYAWDARLDRLLSYCESSDKVKLNLIAYSSKLTIRDKFKYVINRYALLIIFQKIISFFLKMLKSFMSITSQTIEKLIGQYNNS